MESIIIASIISAAGKLTSTLLQKWDSSPILNQDKIDKFLDMHFDDLRKYLTNKCVKILIETESGKSMLARELRKVVYPGIGLNDPLCEKLDNEFEYRLRYLATMGLLACGIQSEYFITRLGRSFVEKARKTSEYYELFHLKQS